MALNHNCTDFQVFVVLLSFGFDLGFVVMMLDRSSFDYRNVDNVIDQLLNSLKLLQLKKIFSITLNVILIVEKNTYTYIQEHIVAYPMNS